MKKPEGRTNKRAHLSIRHRCKFHIDQHLSFQLAFRSLSMSLLAFTIFKKSYGPWTMVLRNFKKKITSTIVGSNKVRHVSKRYEIVRGAHSLRQQVCFRKSLLISEFQYAILYLLETCETLHNLRSKNLKTVLRIARRRTLKS